jgi:hypothetical protein
VLLIASRVAFIPFFQPGQCISRGDNRLVGSGGIRGSGKLVRAMQTGGTKTQYEAGLSHERFCAVSMFQSSQNLNYRKTATHPDTSLK